MSAEPLPPPRLAPLKPSEFHTHAVPAIMAAPPEIPRELLEVAAWLSRVPWIWRALRDELAEQQARKVHFRLRLDLVGSYGSVKDAHVKLKAIDDLKRRLASTRWPERETVGDWSQGVPLQKAQALVAYWRDNYDWRLTTHGR